MGGVSKMRGPARLPVRCLLRVAGNGAGRAASTEHYVRAGRGSLDQLNDRQVVAAVGRQREVPGDVLVLRGVGWSRRDMGGLRVATQGSPPLAAAPPRPAAQQRCPSSPEQQRGVVLCRCCVVLCRCCQCPCVGVCSPSSPACPCSPRRRREHARVSGRGAPAHHASCVVALPCGTCQQGTRSTCTERRRVAEARGGCTAQGAAAHQCQKPTFPGVNWPFSSKSLP